MGFPGYSKNPPTRKVRPGHKRAKKRGVLQGKKRLSSKERKKKTYRKSNQHGRMIDGSGVTPDYQKREKGVAKK